jgi:hypothetical protein
MQLTRSQITAGTWYRFVDYQPPDELRVIVTDGEYWAVLYTIGRGSSFVWCMEHSDIDRSNMAWQIPSLPIAPMLRC